MTDAFTVQRSEEETANFRIALPVACLQLVQMFVVPLLLAHAKWWGFVLVPLVFISNPFWSLIHEAVHGSFAPSRSTNDRAGRALSILFGGAFDVLKFGHLMHHRYNRAWESEYYTIGEKSHARAAIEYYAKLCGGIYYISTGVTVLFLLLPVGFIRSLFTRHTTAKPELKGLREIAENFFFVRGRYQRIRVDAVCILALWGTSAWLYGIHWPWFAAMVIGRAFCISFMDNIYHYGTPMDNSVPAKELILPAWAQHWILNANHHLSHHRQANRPWKMLAEPAPDTHLRQGFWAMAREQWQGPIPLATPLTHNQLDPEGEFA